MNKKFFDDHCPVARTLNAIGDGWSVLILRNLFLNDSQRFQDFLESTPGLVPSTLSGRLKVLESKQIIQRQFYSEHPPRSAYRLTEKGRSLGPIMLALKEWGEKYDTST